MAKSALTTKDLCEIAIFTVITVVLSQIAIPLPFTPVPISCGMIALYTTGILLAPKSAFFSQVVYLLLGIVGLPVFHNFTGGIGHFVGPTGGFLFVYPLVSLIISLSIAGFEKRPKPQSKFRDGAALRLCVGANCLVGICLLYLVGAWWFMNLMGVSFAASAAMTVLPFIPLDIFKILFCVFLVVPIRARLISAHLIQPASERTS